MKVEEIEFQICQTGNDICKQTLPTISSRLCSCLLLVVQENKLKFRKIVFLHKIIKMSTHFSVNLLDIECITIFLDCKLYFMIFIV